MKIPVRKGEARELIPKIVDYYMNFVVGHEHEFREFLNYYWSCMSTGTLDDYGEMVDKAYNIDLANEIKEMRQEIDNLRAELDIVRSINEH